MALERELDQLIQRARRRERRVRYLRATLRALLPVLGAAIVLGLLERFLSAADSAIGWPLALLAPLIALPFFFGAWRARPSDLELARRVDRALDLDSALANGLELRGDDPHSRLTRRRATRIAPEIDVRSVFKYEAPKRPWAAPLLAMIFIAIQWMPSPQSSEPEDVDGEAARAAGPLLSRDSVAAFEEQIDARADTAEGRELHPIMEELRALLQAMEEGTISRDEAIERLAELEASLGQGDEHDGVGGGASASMASSIEARLERIAKAMEQAIQKSRIGARGEEAAQEGLGALSSALAEASMPNSMAKAAEAAEKLAQQLSEQLAEGLAEGALDERAQRDLRQAFDAALSAERESDAELERVREARERLEQQLLEGEEAAEREQLLQREREQLEQLRQKEARLESERRALEELRRQMEELATQADEDSDPSKALLKMARLLERLGVDLERFRDTELAKKMMQQLRDQLRGDEHDALRRSLIEEFASRAGGGQGMQGMKEAQHGEGAQEPAAGAKGREPGTEAGSRGAQDGSQAGEEASSGAKERGAGDSRDQGEERQGDERSHPAQAEAARGEPGGPSEGAGQQAAGELAGAAAGQAAGEASAQGAGDGSGAGSGDGPGASSGAPEALSALETQHVDSRVEGVVTRPPSRSETILTARAQGFVGEAYKRVHTDYSAHAEEVLERESIPPGYRHAIQRYFQLIRPRAE